jgi:hypothetical protein
VFGMTVFAGELYVGGAIGTISGVTVGHLAKWDGSAWTTLGPWDPGMGRIFALHPMNGGLFVGGEIGGVGGQVSRNAAFWTGSSWVPMGDAASGPDDWVRVFAHDSSFGPDLFVGGDFTNIGWLQPTGGIARWTGSSWGTVGTGLSGNVRSLCFYNDGSGLSLYVGGSFGIAGGVPVGSIARWDGTNWSSVGTGMNNGVLALAVFDDGTGPALYAGGAFTSPASRIAKWNGTSWLPVGAGVNSSVTSMTVFDDGSGPALYVGGTFTMAGGAPATQVAKWNGTVWSALGSPAGGTSGIANALLSFDDGSDGIADLYVGGQFLTAGGTVTRAIAEWRTCSSQPLIVTCRGDGSGAACPCGNYGTAGSGCANSMFMDGALLEGTGVASASGSSDTFVLTASNIPGPCLFFQGSSQLGISGIPFGDGLLCVGGSVIRLGLALTGSTIATYPNGMTPTPIHVAGSIVAGSVRHYQSWYRDAAAFCTPATYNLTQGLTVTWVP